MKTLIVGDLHGKLEVAERALASSHNVIFIGDYLDDFTRSVDDQIRTLRLVLNACVDEPERVQGLLGNHELNYLAPGMRCSGFNTATEAHVMHMDLKPLKNYVWCGDFLVSHAGVSARLLKAYDATLQEYLESEEFYQVGRYRGGWEKIGGLFWCDWFYEFQHLEDVPQIVGHSGSRISNVAKLGRMGITPVNEPYGILRRGNSYNVDCYNYRQEFLLIDDNGKDVEVTDYIN